MFIALLCMMISLDCYELCIHVRDNNIADTNYNYMYTLKYPEKEVPDGGSPALAKTLKKQIYGYNWDVTVLGIEKGNSYFDANVEKGKGKVVASSALVPMLFTTSALYRPTVSCVPITPTLCPLAIRSADIWLIASITSSIGPSTILRSAFGA